MRRRKISMKTKVSIALIFLVLLSACGQSTEKNSEMEVTYTIESETNSNEQNCKMKVEGVTYDVYSDGIYVNVKIRNESDKEYTKVRCHVDAIDEKGDVVSSSGSFYEGVLSAGQACVAQWGWFDGFPYGVRIASGYCIDKDGEQVDFYLETPFIDYLNQTEPSPKNNSNEEANIIGSWHAKYLIIDGKVYDDSSDTAKVTAEFFDNYTGEIIVDTDVSKIEWEYLKTDSEGFYYKIKIGTDSRNIVLINDRTSDEYGLLVVYLTDETGILFEKD